MEKATNGQFRELIGKLLVKGSDEKVTLIDKTKIQKAIDNPDWALDCFLRFLGNGCEYQKIIYPHIIKCNEDNAHQHHMFYQLLEHTKHGNVLWDPNKIRFIKPKDKEVINGFDFRKKLLSNRKITLLNLNVMDYLLANPHIIPDEWKSMHIMYFMGTVMNPAGCKNGEAPVVYGMEWDANKKKWATFSTLLSIHWGYDKERWSGPRTVAVIPTEYLI